MVKREAFLRALHRFGCAKFADRFLFHLYRFLKVTSLCTSSGQGVDVIPIVPGINTTGGVRIFDRLLTIAKSRVRTGRIDPCPVTARQRESMNAGP